MKLHIAAAALLVLAATGANGFKCKAGDEQETLLGAMATLLPAAALICNVKDPSVGASFYALKPSPDCEDDTGENIHKGIKAVTDVCATSGSKGGAVARNKTAPAKTAAAPKAEESTSPAPAPAKLVATSTAMMSVATVGLLSVAWFVMA